MNQLFLLKHYIFLIRNYLIIVLQMFYSCQLFLFRRAARGVKVRLDKKKKDTGPSKVSTYSRLTNTKQVITFVLHAFVLQY